MMFLNRPGRLDPDEPTHQSLCHLHAGRIIRLCGGTQTSSQNEYFMYCQKGTVKIFPGQIKRYKHAVLVEGYQA